MGKPIQVSFREDGTFRLLQITDVQETPDFSPDTLRLLAAALDHEQPDLVVFTGDQLKGYSRPYRAAGASMAVEKAIQTLLLPLEERHIPFAVTFGNHDRQAAPSLSDQLAIYQKSPLFVSGIPGAAAGNCCIPIWSRDKKRILFALYLLDSGGNAKGGGYEAIPLSTLSWYRRTCDHLAETAGKPVPALVFQHIPLPEYYQVLEPVLKTSPRAVRAYRTHRDQWFRLPDFPSAEVEFMEEPPSVPDTNHGEFSVIKQDGNVLGIFCGHDHKNCFVRSLEGIDLGYTPSCGFHEYGPGLRRGVRTLILRESDPHSYKTRVLTYRELCGKKVSAPFRDFFYRHSPATVDAALHLLWQLCGGLAVVVAVILCLLLL